MTYIPRRLGEEILRHSAHYPAIALVGPRQSGKSTLVRRLFPDYPYVTLESLDNRRAALDDPRGFLRDLGPRAVLDEVQRTPELFSYLQEYLDDPDTDRQYVLTGSHQFLLMEQVTQSLAGRIATFRLYPLTISELEDMRDAATEDVLLRGFYPRVHERAMDPTTWYDNYVQTYLERDIRQIVNVADIRLFETFLKVVATHSGQMLNKAVLANRVGVSEPTVARWVAVLEASGIVMLVPAYHSNLNKRLIRSPRIYLLDSGLLCFLLGVFGTKELRAHPLYGSIFESFVAAELYKRISHSGSKARLHHWRDRTGREIDLVIEDGQRVTPVEIKSAATWHSDFKRHLEWWVALPGNAATEGVVIYDGDRDWQTGSAISGISWRRIPMFR